MCVLWNQKFLCVSWDQICMCYLKSERESEREEEDLDLLKSVEVCNSKLLKRERKSSIYS